jgi:uncharacterized membrane protein (DUF373 family)
MATPENQPPARLWVARAFTVVEELAHVGVGVVLAACAIDLLVHTALGFARGLLAGATAAGIPALVDQILLIMLVVELLYTVRASLREHTVAPEPFLLVGLIAAIRRVLLLTAKFGELREGGGPATRYFLQELAVLTALIVALAASLYLLRERAAGRGQGPEAGSPASGGTDPC